MRDDRRRVRRKITNERKRQDDKWGGPKHDDAHDDVMWLLILNNQLGKIASAMVNCGFDDSNEDTEAAVNKLAAVAVAWLEARERGRG